MLNFWQKSQTEGLATELPIKKPCMACVLKAGRWFWQLCLMTIAKRQENDTLMTLRPIYTPHLRSLLDFWYYLYTNIELQYDARLIVFQEELFLKIWRGKDKGGTCLYIVWWNLLILGVGNFYYHLEIL